MKTSELTKLKDRIDSCLTRAVELTETGDHLRAYAQVKEAQTIFHSIDLEMWLRTTSKKERQCG